MLAEALHGSAGGFQRDKFDAIAHDRVLVMAANATDWYPRRRFVGVVKVQTYRNASLIHGCVIYSGSGHSLSRRSLRDQPTA